MCDKDNTRPCRPPCYQCEGCRTINLALHNKGPKPSLTSKINCVSPQRCEPDWSTPMNPTCIRIITPEEYRVKFGGQLLPKVKVPYRGHGWLMYGVKAALVAGAMYFTYRQGVWGDHPESMEAVRRWQEYFRSFSTRVPPKYDPCGRVIPSEPTGGPGFLASMYGFYKAFITNIFSGIVKLPMVAKCWYLAYLAQMEQKEIELAAERKLKKHQKQNRS